MPLKGPGYNTVKILAASRHTHTVNNLFTACSKSNSAVTDGLRVPEGYTIEKVADSGLLSYPMFASFDNEGRLFVFESSGKTTTTEDVLANPTFMIRVLEDVENGDGVFDKRCSPIRSPYPMGGTYHRAVYMQLPLPI